MKIYAKDIFETGKQRGVTMKFGRLVVFIRHDPSEIWGFRYGLTLCIGSLKIKARIGVFVHVICALKYSISSFSTTSA